jgi:hypothetical protein
MHGSSRSSNGDVSKTREGSRISLFDVLKVILGVVVFFVLMSLFCGLLVQVAYGVPF